MAAAAAALSAHAGVGVGVGVGGADRRAGAGPLSLAEKADAFAWVASAVAAPVGDGPLLSALPARRPVALSEASIALVPPVPHPVSGASLGSTHGPSPALPISWSGAAALHEGGARSVAHGHVSHASSWSSGLGQAGGAAPTGWPRGGVPGAAPTLAPGSAWVPAPATGPFLAAAARPGGGGGGPAAWPAAPPPAWPSAAHAAAAPLSGGPGLAGLGYACTPLVMATSGPPRQAAPRPAPLGGGGWPPA
jgi:hypothetical protein